MNSIIVYRSTSDGVSGESVMCDVVMVSWWDIYSRVVYMSAAPADLPSSRKKLNVAQALSWGQGREGEGDVL